LAPVEVEVLTENLVTVEVFGACQLTFAGMGQPIGISATEITCAMHALRVPRNQRGEVLQGVRYMGGVAAQALAEVAEKQKTPARGKP
jgi:hypothetical protein